ncbi:MAG: M23 family metallopeptidase [Clostridia bacterium]|nr:M23 family metallopeptidase [Clostridia bacterium]
MIILAIILVRSNCKIAYKVTLNGDVVGYVTDKDKFTCTITNKVLNQDNENIEVIVLNEIPKYSLAIINKNKKTDEESIISILKLKADVTYKLYAITLAGEDKAYVNTLEEAKEKVSELTEKYGKNSESEFGVREVYTENIFEYKNMKYATATKLSRDLDNEEKSKEQAEKNQKAIQVAKAEENTNASYVNGVCFSIAPVSGRISSRYGANESIRNHTHKGLDIAASNGTPIKAAADGVVTYAAYSGGYGYLVKISHGNGVESYYGHCSKLYVTAGQTVKAGDTIAAVGSTGNSTGNHLHFEIRLNGTQVNPQNYLYN